MKKLNYVWRYRIFDDGDYSLELEFEAKHKLLNKAFQKVITPLKRKYGGAVEVDKEFDAPASKFKLVAGIVQGSVKLHLAEMEADGFIPLSNFLDKVKFMKKSDGSWKVKVIYSGAYSKKR